MSVKRRKTKSNPSGWPAKTSQKLKSRFLNKVVRAQNRKLRNARGD